MTDVRLSEGVYLKAWVVFFLVATIGGFIAGAVAGGIVGFVLGGAGADLNTITLCGMVAGFVVSLPISYLAYRMTATVFIVPRAVEEARRAPEVPPAVRPRPF